MNADPRSSDNTITRTVRLARQMLPPIHPAGKPFIASAVLAALVLRWLARPLGTIGFLAAAAVAWFFREPKRIAPDASNLAVAPADGTIAAIREAGPPEELGIGSQPRTRISVFLSVFDVHVQRLPASGTVGRVSYRPGAFLSADLDKASDDNERNSIMLRTGLGHELVVVQIAGLVARRISCEIGEGDAGTAGTTYGLIRFGSRVDTFLPAGSRLLVAEGQRAIGGETPLAELPSQAAENKSSPSPAGS